MSALTIRRWVETDTGHRVPAHASKCRNFHGHRYRWEAEVAGDPVQVSGVSSEGMLMDFGELSTILREHIHDVVDHAFLVYEGDATGRAALELLGPEHRTVVLPFIPTAENLARWAYEQVAPRIRSVYGNALRLHALTVRETPKSWARWQPLPESPCETPHRDEGGMG